MLGRDHRRLEETAKVAIEFGRKLTSEELKAVQVRRWGPRGLGLPLPWVSALCWGLVGSLLVAHRQPLFTHR